MIQHKVIWHIPFIIWLSIYVSSCNSFVQHSLKYPIHASSRQFNQSNNQNRNIINRSSDLIIFSSCIIRRRSNIRIQRTSLPATLTIPTIGAGSALVVGSLTAALSDRIFPNTGILAAIVSSALISNMGIVPSCHYLYDLCWSVFLPASLALLLFGYRTEVDHEKKSVDGTTIKSSIQSVAVPFVLASLGSLVGCLLSYLCCCKFPRLWLSPSDAKVATACLVSSYIGGTVNFFATARIIQVKGTAVSGTLMGAMATADLILMALYFCCLAASMQSSWMKSLYGSSSALFEGVDDERRKLSTTPRLNIARLASGTVLVSALSYAVVVIANRFEQWASPIVPGMACAVIAILVPMIKTFFPDDNRIWSDMQYAASPLSELCFHLLFASLGVTANIREALRNGPACLCFSALALLAHIILIFVGALQTRALRFLPRAELEDILVASNAAIGGPVTAATFVGRLMKGRRQRGLTMAAMFWGIFGYAIATAIGVRIFEWL